MAPETQASRQTIAALRLPQHIGPLPFLEGPTRVSSVRARLRVEPPISSRKSLSLQGSSSLNPESKVKRRTKSTAMFWGEFRAQQRERAIARAEAAFTEGRYGDAVRFARIAVQCKSRYRHRSRQKVVKWRARLLARIHAQPRPTA